MQRKQPLRRLARGACLLGRAPPGPRDRLPAPTRTPHVPRPACPPAELLDGAAKLAGSRARLAAAEEEAKAREGRLADLQRGILEEAEHAGLDLPGLAGRDDAADEDAAWEQLAATIQQSERAACAADEADAAEQQRQGPSPDGGLQAAMQEAAMEGERVANCGGCGPACLGSTYASAPHLPCIALAPRERRLMPLCPPGVENP